VIALMLEHAELLCAWFGEHRGVRMFRQHGGWYTKGFRGGSKLRPRIMAVETLDALRAVLAEIGHDEPFAPAAMRVPRGKSGGRQRVVLPEGWLDDRDDPMPPGVEAEDETSGG